jgi:hypothetical protein
MVKTEPSPSSFSAVVYATNEVANRCEPLSEVWWQGRQWAVTSYGLECRDGTYFIDAPRIGKDLHSANPYSWIAHLGDNKTWIDLEDFATAFFIACSMHRVSLSKADVDLLREHFASRFATIARRKRERAA